MNFWYWFWVANFAVAGSAFVVILVVVAVRGARDLAEMFRVLREEKLRPRG